MRQAGPSFRQGVRGSVRNGVVVAAYLVFLAVSGVVVCRQLGSSEEAAANRGTPGRVVLPTVPVVLQGPRHGQARPSCGSPPRAVPPRVTAILLCCWAWVEFKAQGLLRTGKP